jgi:class 3 adenylate cyclase
VKTALALGVRGMPAMSQSNRTSELLTVWSSRQPSRLRLEEYVTLGKRANALGECLIAYDIAIEGLRSWPKDKALLQIEALALARMGSWMQARELLTELAREADPDEETLGLLARTYKDLWLASKDIDDLERAYRAYADAYQYFPERFWTGINAATLAFARRDRDAAYRLADAIRGVCLEKLETDPEDQRYWLVSTIAEASLILNDIEEAERRYREAARIGHNDLGNLITTRRNLRILLEFFSPQVAERLGQALEMPKVAVFTGHRADTHERVSPRLPPEVVPAVGAAIQARLMEDNVRVGYSSAASGSDILFLEALQKIGGRTHIVLPCAEEQFLEESVIPSEGDWETRFRDVVVRADEVFVASNERLILRSVGYEYANEILYGLASVQADRLDTGLVRMAVWDGRPGDGPGGTADMVSRWRSAGHPVVVIPPVADWKTTAAARPRPKSSRQELRRPREAKVPGFASEIRAMIFADAYHFSKLSEDQMPSFIQNFMGVVAELLSCASPSPLYLNTWGDGLFFVFAKAADAGRFALKLARRAAAIDRTAAGLPADMNLRIALHVGPVYRFKDPITGKKNYIGSHVNQTARIEPSTPPGQIYGSQAFVALAALEAPGDFHFEYVGRIPLAKNFGEFPMYHIQTALDRRRNAAGGPVVGAAKL